MLDWLKTADPDDLAALAATAANTLPGWRDQYQAAARETGNACRVTVARSGGTCLPGGRVPDVVLLQALDILARWCDGGIRLCLHAPHPSRPEPVATALWRPGLIVCGRCPHLLTLRPGSVADRSCDLCGHVAEGTEHGDPIYPATFQHGPLVVLFGACRDCHQSMTHE